MGALSFIVLCLLFIMDIDSLMAKWQATDPEYFKMHFSHSPHDSMFSLAKAEYYSSLEDDSPLADICDGVFNSDELAFLVDAIYKDEPVDDSWPS